MREKIIETIEKEKLIAILRGIPSDKLIDTVSSLYIGGVRLVEITYNFKNVSDEETAENIKKLCDAFKDKMIIGAGTVTTKKQVILTAKAGGKFIISPNTDKQVIKHTKKLGMVSIPGALTPTEICSAHKYGADFVKLFPVSNLGKDYIKAVKAPLSNIKLLAVGGIDETNLSEYMKTGISGVGIGSNIVDTDAITNDKFEVISLLANKYTEVLKNG